MNDNEYSMLCDDALVNIQIFPRVVAIVNDE